jgi:uncharacterized protein
MNWLILPLLLVFTMPVAALPPPLPQVTADCDQPTYASDMLVCADPELRKLDDSLAQRLSELSQAVERVTVEEGDEDWFRRSRMCAFESNHRDCLLRAYCARIVLLADAAATPPGICVEASQNTP